MNDFYLLLGSSAAVCFCQQILMIITLAFAHETHNNPFDPISLLITGNTLRIYLNYSRYTPEQFNPITFFAQ